MASDDERKRLRNFYSDILDEILLLKVKDKRQLHRLKMKLSKRYQLGVIPSDADILAQVPPQQRAEVEDLLRTKPTRTLSGVAVVAVMTSPAPCPHGKCSYCPGGPDVGTPQSYTGREPAAMRAARNRFDPYKQTEDRLKQLRATGHPTDKIDLIVMGGTFTAREPEYMEWFVKRCFDALNGTPSNSLQESHTLNETAHSRCIGLTVETRPDCFGQEEVAHSMKLGATRVELGVQTIFDEILEAVNRGHGTEEVIKATKLSKDSGMKVCYHLMPGLPGSSMEMDMACFERIFSDPLFRPDMLKLYPTLVIKGTELYKMWKRGEYEPYNTEELVQLLARMKRIVPRWVRIQRIQRDVPIYMVEAGLDKGNLRELVQKHMKESGERCHCIRCREVGRATYPSDPENVEMKRTDYMASGGVEVFLSFEDTERDVLIAYGRLRRCDSGAFLRELKVFGQVVPIHEGPRERWQHRGYGKALLEACEEIVRNEWGISELRITSGVGARPYYRKFGYNQETPYMVKRL